MEAKWHVIKQWMGQQWSQGRNQKIPCETNENEDTTIPTLWDTGKVILRGKNHSITGLSQKQEKAQINNLTSHL